MRDATSDVDATMAFRARTGSREAARSGVAASRKTAAMRLMSGDVSKGCFAAPSGVDSSPEFHTDMGDKLAMSAVRRSNRFRVIMNLPLKLGRKDGTLVDISEAGVLATHAGILKTGSIIEISFTHEGQRFSSPAKVETCTVVGLGAGPAGATLYASRLFFQNLSDEAKAILEAVLKPEATP